LIERNTIHATSFQTDFQLLQRKDYHRNKSEAPS